MKFPTRGDATLDLVLTNLGDHFSTPECFPPFGLSDHCTVIVQPRKRVPNQHTRKSITIRDIRDSNKMCLGRYFSSINWSVVISQPTCEEKLQVFNEVIEIGMSNIFDYRKAFDLIDHKSLVNKLRRVNIPNSVINWVIDFLSGRSQRVKLGKDCVSEWGTVPSGVPQGTKLGPWLFLLMINDLTVPSIFNMWKYVDDTTVSENIPKGQQSKSQEAVDAIYGWSKENLFQLNGEKTKELVKSFSRDSPQLPRVCIDGTPIKTIQSTKLLGLTINDTLTWNDHIEELVKKASKKLAFLFNLSVRTFLLQIL